MRFVVEGKVLSKVACHNERRVRAEQENKSIEEIPLTYGSIRIAVNKIRLNDKVYNIDKSSEDALVKEQRLILEISYKYDTEGNIIEDHSVVEDLLVGSEYELTMDRSFIRKNHYLKFINAGSNQTIKSYFLKSWANDIYYVDICTLGQTHNIISPKQVLQKRSVDKELIIV